MEEKEEGRRFSFPLHQRIVDEIMVNDLVGNVLDEKFYGLVCKKYHVVDSFKRESVSYVKKSRSDAWMLIMSVCN